MKNFIFEKHNSASSLLVISGYPKRRETYSKGVCAVSSFAKNTLINLQKENLDRKIVVLTMETGKKETYEEDGMLIIRCFKRNSPLSYLSLLSNILNFNKAKDVLVEFEFASFGDTFTTGLLLLLIWALFFFGKNITLVMHQVLENIKELSGHIGISKANRKMAILNLSLRFFYKFLTLPAKKIIVLEEEFKDRLAKITNSSKITVIPHGVDTNIKSVDRALEREKLGIKKDEFVILYFGYLTWYKGVDFLIKALKDITTINNRKIKLVIAGGESFTQKEKSHYKIFINMVKRLLNTNTNIIQTGFVDEVNITAVFESSDLVVLPYRTFMSSSGPLSLAISHKKPFILSRNLEGLLNSFDVKKAMLEVNLDKNAVLFDLNKKSLTKAIESALNNKTRQKMINFSRILNEARSFENIAKIYNAALESLQTKINVNYKFISSETQ